MFIWPSILFSSTELLATFLHWDVSRSGRSRSTSGSSATSCRRQCSFPSISGISDGRHPFPKPDRRAAAGEPASPLMCCSAPVAGLLAVAGVLRCRPSIIPLMPWTFTPLTLRALSGWILAARRHDAHRRTQKTTVPAAASSRHSSSASAGIAIEVARYPQQVNWSHPTVYVGSSCWRSLSPSACTSPAATGARQCNECRLTGPGPASGDARSMDRAIIHTVSF